MSGAVDVLAVMDDLASNILIPNGGAYADEIREARAAVAELIEAGRSLLDGEPDDAAWGRFESALNCVVGAE